MDLPNYFKDFLAEIRPTADQRTKMKKKHRELRDHLETDDELRPLIISTFIQGSYRRFTATRAENGDKCDVDVIAVTNMHESDFSARNALEKFRPFLEKHYSGQYRLQGRSWGIEVDDEVTLDLVPTSAPSEAEQQAMEWTRAAAWDFPEERGSLLLNEDDRYFFESFLNASATPQWKEEPLRIPDREADEWDDTHPLEQIRWTWQKNRDTNSHYVNVVKAIKWWRKVQQPWPKYPKSYPLEHMIGNCCPDGISSVGAGVTAAFEAMEMTYRPLVLAGLTPVLGDRGVPHHNVLNRVAPDDFASFLNNVSDAADLARRALDAESVKESADLWRELFGTRFPAPPAEEGDAASQSGAATGGFTPRVNSGRIGEGRFA